MDKNMKNNRMLEMLKNAGKFCTGCGACYNVCPVDAIRMVPDQWGFLYPEIDHGSCVDCKKCENVCPKLECMNDNLPEPECYAARGADPVRAVSSSGGIFTHLARMILARGGIVCGAAMNPDFSVQHICVKDEEGLAALRKSKYVQSDTGLIYREIASYLKEGKEVLFTGTPGQVAAAKKFFGREAKNIYYVDILCHGVPSVQMLQDYMRENFDLEKVDYIDFRSKLNGWRCDQFRVFWKDKTSTLYPCENSTYELGFHRNISLRDGCENCEFSGHQRQGDLTLGDFWRVAQYDPRLNDHKGTSVVLVNNEQGKALLDGIRKDLVDLTQTPIEAARFNRLKKTFSSHPQKQRFRTMYPAVQSFSKAVMQCRHSLYDIGLVGNYLIGNYGGHLTQYALYATLTDMGYSVLMIERPRNAPERPLRKVPNIFEKIPYAPYALGKIYETIAEMKVLNNQCDVFVTGSDQMFNHNLYTAYGKIQVQNFVFDNHWKVAYAASFGHDRIWGSESDRAEEAYYMQKFDAFSVREDSAVKLCREQFGVEATHVLDPVFLCPVQNYQNMVDFGKKYIPKQAYLFAYILDPDTEKENCLRLYADQNNLTIRAISDLTVGFGGAKKAPSWDIETLTGAKIESWLAHIAESSFFITDSFHGMCFAIIFKKNFLAIVNKERGETRFTSLVKLLGLEDRLVYSFAELQEKLKDLPPIDYDAVYEKLEKERCRCRQWLQESIEAGKDKPKAMSAFDMLDVRCDDITRMFNDRFAHLYAELEKRGVHIPPPDPPKPESWLKRKIKGGIRCYKENGLVYTVKRLFQKIRNKLRGC